MATQICFIFIPTWGNDPIWRAYFSNGLKPPTSFSNFFWPDNWGKIWSNLTTDCAYLFQMGWGKNQQLDLLKGLQSIEQFINARVYPRKLHLSMGSVLGRRALISLSNASFFVEKMLLNNGLLPTWCPFHGCHFSSWSGKTCMITWTCWKPCFDTSQTSTYTTWIHIVYPHVLYLLTPCDETPKTPKVGFKPRFSISHHFCFFFWPIWKFSPQNHHIFVQV